MSQQSRDVLRLTLSLRDNRRQILSEKVAPFDGAMKIWKDIIDNTDGNVSDDLWPFKSNASAIEDCKSNAKNGGANADELIKQCEQEILIAAKKLIEEK